MVFYIASRQCLLNTKGMDDEFHEETFRHEGERFWEQAQDIELIFSIDATQQGQGYNILQQRFKGITSQVNAYLMAKYIPTERYSSHR